MLHRYDRGARSLTDLQIAPFPDISDTVPELRNVRALPGRSLTPKCPGNCPWRRHQLQGPFQKTLVKT